MSLSTYYDGDYTAAEAVGPAVLRIDPVTQSEIVTQKYHQIATHYEGSLRSSVLAASPFSSYYFVEESTPSIVGGEVLEFERTYAALPSSRNESEPYTYHGQQTVGTLIIEYGVATTARAAFDYHISTDGTDVELIQPYKLQIIDGVIYASGTGGGGELVAEASSVSRWRGNIFERKTLYVTPVVFAEV